MSIVTKTGDEGTTGIYGNARLKKDHPRIEAIGTVDELNALIGCVLTTGEVRMANGEKMDQNSQFAICNSQLLRVQHLLFALGADLATPLESFAPTHRIQEKHITELETWIHQWEAHLPELQWFILPGGTAAGSSLHHARTVCRRAERCIVTLKASEAVNPRIPVFLNRLGDLLFLLARAANREAGVEEVRVQYEGREQNSES